MRRGGAEVRVAPGGLRWRGPRAPHAENVRALPEVARLLGLQIAAGVLEDELPHHVVDLVARADVQLVPGRVQVRQQRDERAAARAHVRLNELGQENIDAACAVERLGRRVGRVDEDDAAGASGRSTSSSSVAYAPAMAEKGVAMASKVGSQVRRTKSTTAAGDSYCWCSLMVTSLSPAAAAVSSQRLSPRRPPDLATQGGEVRQLLEPQRRMPRRRGRWAGRTAAHLTASGWRSERAQIYSLMPTADRGRSSSTSGP